MYSTKSIPTMFHQRMHSPQTLIRSVFPSFHGVKHLYWPLIVLVLSAGQASLYAAESSPLLLNQDQESVSIGDAIDYILDPGDELDISDVMEMNFSRLQDGDIDFGFTTDKIWLRFSVTNSSTESLDRILRTNARFMRPLEIFLVRGDSSIQRLLYNDETQKFNERPLPELRYIATEFSLEPLETATFLIRFGSGGRAAMDLDISSREQALAEQYSASLGITLFSAILLTLILVNFFHYLAVRQLAYLFYIFYESFNVLYVSHMEGFTWQYLWPNLPQWNDDATPIIASIGVIIGNLFAMIFLEARKYTPRLHKLFLCLIALSTLALIITLIAGNRLGNQITASLLPLSLLLSLLTAAIAVRKGHYLARYFLVAWAMFAVGAAIWSGTILGIFSVTFDVMSLYKLTIATQAIILSMGLADQIRRINSQYLETQDELIENLQGRLEDAKERLQLERENEKNMLQLLQKSRQLATTSHDINQPIQSLRLSLKALDLKSDNKETTAQLNKTLDHMESILGDALDEASIDLKKSSENSNIQSLVIGNLIKDVVSQFAGQARKNNLKLRGFESKMIIVTRELSLKRCLMNLVSNALNNTKTGGVLFGARRRGDKILLQVYDTGKGMSSEEIKSMMEPLAKGGQSTGHGLGLAIITETCAEYGWDFSIQSKENNGSCFTIAVPIRV